jgi:transaldolase
MAKTPLQKLADHRQSVWIDYLSRDLLRSGELARMMREDAVVGVTSNPTIFQKALSSSDVYDEQLQEVLAETSDAKEIFIRLAATDVGDAANLLRVVWEKGSHHPTPNRAATGRRARDGYVSIEVDPTLAYDTEATTAEAKRLHALIDRPNVFVKIPATKPGLPAIEDMIAKGKSINVTLIFALDRYVEVASAYIRGLERLVAAGGDPKVVASVASFFVSRVDTEADRRLDEIGGSDGLKGKLAVANAKLAYQRYKELFSGERWEFLASKGATPQRCLWASTSTKNPDYSDVMYVEELIGPMTVNTMPEETIRAFQDHGKVAPTLERGIDGAKRVFEWLAKAGIDYDDVTETLEREGVEKFAASFAELLEGIKASSRELVAA